MRVSRTRDPTLDLSVIISFKNANSSLQGNQLMSMIAKKQALIMQKRK